MRHEVRCPGRERGKVFDERQGHDLQCQLAEHVFEDERAKRFVEFQNAMFAAEFCRRENHGRCEGCGQ